MKVNSGELSRLGVKRGPISLLIANSRSTFDSAAHFYGGETTNLTLPPAIPADSLVYFGPDLVLARWTLYGIFSECFIPSTIDTSKRDKAPVGLCIRHRRLLALEEHGATVSNFTEGLRPTTGAGQQHHAGHCRTVRREQLGRGRRGRRVPGGGDRGVSPTGACLLGSAHVW
jgi:hypothetical protein